MSAKDQDTAPCLWYQRVYKSLCPISWVSSPKQDWDPVRILLLLTFMLEKSQSQIFYSQISTFLGFFSLHLRQVQKWDEQLEAGSFPGKI